MGGGGGRMIGVGLGGVMVGGGSGWHAMDMEVGCNSENGIRGRDTLDTVMPVV